MSIPLPEPEIQGSRRIAMSGPARAGGVLVTDGNERAALAVVRSLGKRGIAVYVGAEETRSLAGVSRYCRHSFAYPSPWTFPEDYVSCLLDRARRWEAAVLLPLTDVAVEVIGESRGRIGPEIAPAMASLAQYRALSDKVELTARARQEGIPVPETLLVPDGDIGNVVDRIDSWPVVVKPGRSLVKSRGLWTKTSVHYARDADDLRRLYHENEYLKEPSLLQSRIIGEGQGVFGLFAHGEPLALFAHRRIREKPPSGGVSVLRESIRLAQPMTDYAARLARSVNWHGVMMVEFKVEKASGVPYLMEVNGRFWGSLQLAIDAGVDFPWLLYQLATSGAVPDVPGTYDAGVRSRWWLGDLDHLLLRLRKSDRELGLAPGTPSRAETIVSFFRVWDPRTKSEVFRLSDARPGLLELAGYCGAFVRRLGSALTAQGKDVRALVNRVRWNAAILAGVHRAIIRARLPRKVSRVLVLCRGNICRSPFAAGLLSKRATERQIPLDVRSAGLDTTRGREAYPLAKAASRGFDVDLDQHRTMPVTTDMISWADLILVMETVHVVNLRRMSSAARSKTFLLGHFASRATTDIADPYAGTAEIFRRCYSIIDDSCDGFLAQITGQASQPVVNYSR